MLHLNQHVKALKESIAWLSGIKDTTVEIVVDLETYYNLQSEYMMEDLNQPFTIHGVTIVPRDNN